MTMLKEITVPQSAVGLLYEDGAFATLLAPGRHEFKIGWFDRTTRRVELVDMRQRSLTIKGQEILTKDKVAIRVSLLVYFQVTDAESAVHNVANYEERIYEDVQLSARRFLAGRELEAILSDRNEISEAVRDEVKESANSYGVQILRADVKDLVFPGNLREIMNQVLETERRAEANLIEARRDAETLQIRSEAEHEAQMLRMRTENERIRSSAEADRERLKVQLDAEREEAQVLKDSPQLLKLRQLDALRDMAKNGAKFLVGLQAEDIRTLE